MKNTIRIGVDTGGTFTDFVISLQQRLEIIKIPSTPPNPCLAILEGLNKFLDEKNVSIIHGTTIGTNSLLERKGGPLALITTEGFEDIIFIGRQTRRKLYSLRGEERFFILPRRLCFGIEERTLASGKILRKVNIQELEKIVKKILKSKVKAVSICLLHSYVNPSNEIKIRNKLKKHGFLLSISHEILPEYREYERTTVTTVNAYLMPVMNSYLEELEKNLRQADLRIMQSNEGYISCEKARKEPIRTVLSGPAGGVVGAFSIARSSGFKKIITFDMGGTSTDVSLIDGMIRRTNECLIGDFPIRIPIIDVHSVGAGGGSIAYVDKGGSLRVGPQSAGASPGPACYGKGKLPTVTDANLVLGRLVPEFFLGGKMKIYPEESRRAIKEIAQNIGKTVLETAEGVIEIANANMEKAIRVISIEKGIDPRSFALFSFGGAGGMHATEIASRLNIKTVIIPKNAGVLSALGLLFADSVKDYSKSILKTTDAISKEKLKSYILELADKGLREMKEEGFKRNEIRLFPSLDLRYLGQSYEINIPFTEKFISNFHRAHKKIYSYYHPQRKIEIVNLRLKVIGRGEKITLERKNFQPSNPKTAFFKKQTFIFKQKEYEASVFLRSKLTPGTKIEGPSLVVDTESTAFLPPSWQLEVDGFLNLILKPEEKNHEGIRPH